MDDTKKYNQMMDVYMGGAGQNGLLVIERVAGARLSPFAWFVTDDETYYREVAVHSKGLQSSIEVLIAPTHDEVVSCLRNRGYVPPVVAPYPPPSELLSLFVVRVVPPVAGAVTSQELGFLGVSSEEELREKHASEWKRIVAEKLGIAIYEPKLNLSHLIGMEKLKETVRRIKAVQDDPLLRYKGVVLVGVPGVGKSYSAKCVAGELGRWLVELSMGYLVDLPAPVHQLRKIFTYLERLDVPLLLWIDEIEKPISEGAGKVRRVVGELLRILNDLGTDTGYRMDAVFWITANRVEEIESRYPELLRRGRVDVVFFANTPTKSDAADMFEYYMRVFGIKDGLSPSEKEKLLFLVEQAWSHKGSKGRDIDVERFIYTPAEIEQVCKEVARILKTEEGAHLSFDDVFSTACRRVYPIVISMSEAIGRMRGRKEVWDEI